MKAILKSTALSSLFLVNVLSAQINHNIKGFNHIESVTSDGKHIYAADIGKELNPTAKDGDGRIIKMDLSGKIIDSTFSKEKLNAPKGLTIANGVLFAADVDRLVAIDVKSGKKLYDITISGGTSFLNDISLSDNNTLYISATDLNKIYKVNLSSKSYSELPLNKSIQGINGLFFDKKSNRLYINGFGSENKPNGIVGYINLATNEFTRLANIEGYFDGIWLVNNSLYVSNWVAFEKKGIIQTIDITSGKVSDLPLTEPIAGPADFTITKNQLIIPEMMIGEILFINLK
ncbi:MAG: hypothetical protein ACXVC6_01620 [Bacteroidia bacterium]